MDLLLTGDELFNTDRSSLAATRAFENEVFTNTRDLLENAAWGWPIEDPAELPRREARVDQNS